MQGRTQIPSFSKSVHAGFCLETLIFKREKQMKVRGFRMNLHYRYQRCRRRGCNNSGCLQTQTKGCKRSQTQISGFVKKGPKCRKTRANASKRRQTRRNAKSKNFTPFYAPPSRQPKVTRIPGNNSPSGIREKTPTPKTSFSIWSLLRTPGRFITRPLLVHFTTKMSVVRPFSVLRKDEIGP